MSLKSLSIRAVRSGRSRSALLIDLLSSLGNFALSIAIARNASISELGQFALAFAVYALNTGLIRSAIAEPLSAKMLDASDFRRSAGRPSLMGILFGMVSIAVGVAVNNPYLVIAGWSMHGCSLYDYIKLLNQATLNAKVATLQEASWLVLSIGSGILTLTGILTPLGGFACWIGSSAFLGYAFATFLKTEIRPSWACSLVPSRTSFAFGLDFLLGSGTAQISMTVLAGTAGNVVVGAIRGAGTLFGPVTIIVNSARLLLIPVISRHRATKSSDLMRMSVLVSILLVSASLALAGMVCLLPASVGGLLLGDNWRFAAPLLPCLALELVFAAASTVPFAGHRSHDRGKRTLLLRGVMAPIRLLSVIGFGVGFGALGAVTAMACVSALGTAVWWFSYANLVSRERTGKRD